MHVLEHEICDNTYNLYEDGKLALSIKLDPEFDGISIETEKEVFNGPINLLSFSSDVDAISKKGKY